MDKEERNHENETENNVEPRKNDIDNGKIEDGSSERCCLGENVTEQTSINNSLFAQIKRSKRLKRLACWVIFCGVLAIAAIIGLVVLSSCNCKSLIEFRTKKCYSPIVLFLSCCFLVCVVIACLIINEMRNPTTKFCERWLYNILMTSISVIPVVGILIFVYLISNKQVVLVGAGVISSVIIAFVNIYINNGRKEKKKNLDIARQITILPEGLYESLDLASNVPKSNVFDYELVNGSDTNISNFLLFAVYKDNDGAKLEEVKINKQILLPHNIYSFRTEHLARRLYFISKLGSENYYKEYSRNEELKCSDTHFILENEILRTFIFERKKRQQTNNNTGNVSQWNEDEQKKHVNQLYDYGIVETLEKMLSKDKLVKVDKRVK